MKKTFFTLLAAMCCLSAFAGEKMKGAPIMRAIDPPERAESNWVDVEGDCLLVDDITTGFFFFDQGIIYYDVLVQQDLNNPGLYRLVNPWQFWPLLPVAKMTGGNITVDDEFYIEIDATDPDAVKIFPQDAGLDDGEGPSIITSIYGVYDELHYSEMMALAMSGRLEDNVIRFETNASILLVQNRQGYRTNFDGKFAIILPGGEMPIDYTLEVEKEEQFMPDTENNYHFSVWVEDDRVPEIRWAVTTTYPTDEVFEDVAYDGELCGCDDEVVINVEGIDARMAYAVFVTVDDLGYPQDTFVAEMYPPSTPDSWNYMGKADFTEDFFACYFSDIKNETVEVDVEQHKLYEGYYRIKMPMPAWSYADKFETRPDYQGYMYINNTNPKQPYIAQSCVGMIRDGAEFAISSKYCQYVNQFGLALTENLNVKSGGKWEGNVLTFEPEGGLFLRPSTENGWRYVNCRNNPDCDLDKYLHDPTYTVPRFLPGAFKLDMNKALSGVEEMQITHNESPRYFNMQGIEVTQPGTGVYIVRRGENISKETIR